MKRTVFALVITALLLAACGSQKETPPMAEPLVYEQEVRMEAGAPAPMLLPADTSYTAGSGEANAVERLVIQTANLSIVVADPATKMDAIAQLAESMGGFVVLSNIYETYLANGTQVPEASITIRVPAEKLNDTLTQIKADAVEVQSETRSGQDVTQEYTDLSSRLRNLEFAEAQLREIMASATKTEDVMMVFNQLTYVRQEIEVIKGQMQYYEQAAALSAVSVQIVAEATIQPLEIGGWQPVGVARDAIQALINFMQGFVNFLIWLVIFIVPMLAVIVLPIWLIVRGIRNAMRKRKAKKVQSAGS